MLQNALRPIREENSETKIARWKNVFSRLKSSWPVLKSWRGSSANRKCSQNLYVLSIINIRWTMHLCFCLSPLWPLWPVRKNKVKSYFSSVFTECALYSMDIRVIIYLIDSWMCQIDESAFCDLMLCWIIRLYGIKCYIQEVFDYSIVAAKNERILLSLLP